MQNNFKFHVNKILSKLREKNIKLNQKYVKIRNNKNTTQRKQEKKIYVN